MSEHRILLIEHAAALSIDLGRLRIRRPEHPDAFVAPSDIAVLCLHHHGIQVSVHVLRALAEAGAGVLVTDALHLPCAWLWPHDRNGLLARRLRQQIALDAHAKRGELWQALVAARLRTQAANLRALNRRGGLRLERLARLVAPGDVGHHEAQGARHYWAHLFPEPFRREKQGSQDPVNVRLNFGYAVLRSLVARTLVAAGLNPALGLGHASGENAFNLADDFLEPYRFVVERRVALLAETGDFDGPARVRLLGFAADAVRLNGADHRLPIALQESVASYLRILEGRDGALALPEDLASSSAGSDDP